MMPSMHIFTSRISNLTITCFTWHPLDLNVFFQNQGEKMLQWLYETFLFKLFYFLIWVWIYVFIVLRSIIHLMWIWFRFLKYSNFDLGQRFMRNLLIFASHINRGLKAFCYYLNSPVYIYIYIQINRQDLN